jgi:AraC family transcriptional regulator
MNETVNNNFKRQQMREEYTSRINRVIDYIENNIYEELTLETLSRVANFSRFHFHRIFSTMVGETLNHFIQRVRVEKAAVQLVANPKKSITDIAFDCGFSGSAPFSRVFRETFNMSPSQWRSQKYKLDEESKIRKTDSKKYQLLNKIGKDSQFSLQYNYDENHNLKWRINMKDLKNLKQIDADIEVKEMPNFHVAYIRHIGPYAGDAALFESLFGKLFKWAGPRDLLRFPETQVMAVYHDSPDITDEDKLRLSVCITVPEDTKVEGEVGKMVVPGGKFVVGRFEINGDEYPHAWYTVMAGWMPESGWQPDDRLCYELYHNDPKEHPENKHILDICVPVKPL